MESQQVQKQDNGTYLVCRTAQNGAGYGQYIRITHTKENLDHWRKLDAWNDKTIEPQIFEGKTIKSAAYQALINLGDVNIQYSPATKYIGNILAEYWDSLE